MAATTGRIAEAVFPEPVSPRTRVCRASTSRGTSPEGRTEGRTEAHNETLDAIRRKILARRGISDASDQEILAALLEREDQAEFWARLDRPRR